MARIYISSTYNDLMECREVVYKALRGMRHDAIAMEDYRSEGQRPLHKCLVDVESCDLYIGIFAWRYGYVPTEDNPAGESITELEYRKAREVGKECLIFLLDAKAAWPPYAMDMVTSEGESGVRIRALREELQKNALISFFRTPEELATLVSQAVANWERHLGNKEGSYQHNRFKYLEQIRIRYGSVKLPVGPNEGFALHAIFQPLTLRKAPLVTEDIEYRKRYAWQGEDHRIHGGPDVREILREEARQAPVIAESGEDAIKKSQNGRIVILGGPGTGKTTTLKYLVGDQAEKALADPDSSLPVYISLADLAHSGKTLQRYLIDLVEDLGIDESYADVLWEQIDTGRAFICLDGLDEVDPRQRTRMIDLINTWSARVGNIWVIGSRFTEYKGGQFSSGVFTEWELQPMSHELRLQLAERLLPVLQKLFIFAQQSPLSADNFVQQIEQQTQATVWGENPLLFSLAAVVFLKTGTLSESRIRLYHEVIEAVLLTHESDRLYCDLLWRILEALALWLHQYKGRSFTRQDLFTFFFDVQGKLWGEETVELVWRIIQSGILEPVARDTYHFRHQTFQEFLAAAELAQRLTSSNQTMRKEAWALAWSKRTYSRWSEVLRIMVGILAQTSQDLGQSEAYRWIKCLLELRETEEGDQGNLGLQLALTSLGELNELVKWKHPHATALVEQTLSIWLEELVAAARANRIAKSWRLLMMADEVSRLPVYFKRSVINQLVVNLGDRDVNVRKVAAEVLGKQGEEVPLESLLTLLEDENAEVREAGLLALGDQGERVPLESLLPLLEDENAEVRKAAVEVLGDQGERMPLEPLLALLEDEDVDVREAVVLELGERVPLETLFAQLEDEDVDVREAAVYALGALGRQEVLFPLEPLLARLNDKDTLVRWSAVLALGQQGERLPLEPLLALLEDEDEDMDIRVAAVWALGERAPLDFLLTRVEDNNADMRWAVVWALGEQGEQTPLKPLLARLEDENAYVRGSAVEALGEQGERIPLEPLLARLEDEDADVREAAVRILGKQAEQIPLETLLDVFRQRNTDLRCAALQVLGAQPRFIQPLISILQDKNTNVRVEAMWALSNQGEGVPLEPLLARLEDKDTDMREAAIWALSEQGERVPLEPLLARLEDEDANVREAAVRILGKQGERIPLELLLARLEDEDANVREAAVRILGEQGERVPLEPLLARLEDEDANVREAAIWALSEQGERVPLELLLVRLEDENAIVRSAAVKALGKQAERIPFDPIIVAIGDEASIVRGAAIDVIVKRSPEVLESVINEAQAVLQQQPPGRILGSLVYGFMADMIGEMKRSTPMLFDALIPLLDWHYWQVRVKAIEAFGKIRRNIPDRVIKRLLELRNDASPRVQEAVDDALAEILSLETGIEDD